MLSRFSREFNRIYINDTPITGAQSVSASYDLPVENLKYLGAGNNHLNRVPIGMFVGALNLESLFINQDQFINYTGEIGANLKIQYDNNTFIMNSGYMAEYQFSCGVGTIPNLATKWNFYSDFGNIPSPKLPFAMDETNLNIVNPGNIEINFNELETEKINNLTISIKSNRLPIFDATSVKPIDVKLQYPIIITTSFSISLHDYQNKSLFDYPRKQNVYDFNINLKKNNTNTIVNSFNITDALLKREDYNTDVDGSALMQLTYESTISR
jgi:hypothetical protein